MFPSLWSHIPEPLLQKIISLPEMFSLIGSIFSTYQTLHIPGIISTKQTFGWNKKLVREFLTVSEKTLNSQWPKQLRNFCYPLRQAVLSQSASNPDGFISSVTSSPIRTLSIVVLPASALPLCQRPAVLRVTRTPCRYDNAEQKKRKVSF